MFDVKETDGLVWLQVKQDVPWDLATEIMEMLKGDEFSEDQ